MILFARSISFHFEYFRTLTANDVGDKSEL